MFKWTGASGYRRGSKTRGGSARIDKGPYKQSSWTAPGPQLPPFQGIPPEHGFDSNSPRIDEPV